MSAAVQLKLNACMHTHLLCRDVKILNSIISVSTALGPQGSMQACHALEQASYMQIHRACLNKKEYTMAAWAMDDTCACNADSPTIVHAPANSAYGFLSCRGCKSRELCRSGGDSFSRIAGSRA